MTTLSDSIPPAGDSQPRMDTVARELGHRLEDWRRSALRNLEQGYVPASVPPGKVTVAGLARQQRARRLARLLLALVALVLLCLVALRLAVRDAPQRVVVRLVQPATDLPVPQAPRAAEAELPRGLAAPALQASPLPAEQTRTRPSQPAPAAGSGRGDRVRSDGLVIPAGWDDGY